jgi:hypothetical protein
MPQYLLRMSAEYWMNVEALNAEEAERVGHNTAAEDWDGHTWSEIEVEAQDDNVEEIG